MIKTKKQLHTKVKANTKPKYKTSTHTHKDESYKLIKKRITRNYVRQYAIDTTQTIINILPKFAKFYNTLTNVQLIALKFYIFYGHVFYTTLFTRIPKGTQREILFPFSFQDNSNLLMCINGSNIYVPTYNSFSIQDIPKYIEYNYKLRIDILNNFDTIYDMKTCPKLTGNEILMRGMGTDNEFKNYKDGDIFTFDNFISTSLDRNIAEYFSKNDSIFVLRGLTNIPFIYMPNTSIYDTNNKDYITHMNSLDIIKCLHEYVLPRNLEFKIDKIDKGFRTDIHHSDYYKNNEIKHSRSFKTLIELLQKKNIIDANTKADADAKADAKANTKADAKADAKADTNATTKIISNSIIEDTLYDTIKIYYCTFIQWKPRQKIIFYDIINNPKYVLDKKSANTWVDNDDYDDYDL